MKLAWILVALVVIGGIWWFVGMNLDSESTDTKSSVNEDQLPKNAKTERNGNEPQSLVVTYTNEGFSPPTVVLNVGDSVVFRNESSTAFQPASDPHPTHTGLAGFDARTGVAPGQSYTMTFTKAGSWGYHDHLNSAKEGTVVVR